MTTSQKAALSLLISVLLFGAFTALAFTGLFDLIEARFFNPSVTASITQELNRNSESVDNFFAELQTRFSETLKEPAIGRSFLPNQSAEDIFERSRIYGLLAESIDGFQWVRFIDAGGARIHYSTYNPDILSENSLSVAYRNYNEPDYPYARIAVDYEGTPKIIFDEASESIFFSFPFSDSFDVYRGTALFSVSVKAVTDTLASGGKLKPGLYISAISDPPGFLSAASTVTGRVLAPQVAEIWKQNTLKLERLFSSESGSALALISVRSSYGFVLGRLVDEEVFSLPETMKIILLASFFLTVYLIIFLLFNLRQDSVTVVQNRLRQLQISLIEQYYERKGEMDWKRWSRELEQRKDEISVQLKKGIKTASGRKNEDIDILIDKSWDELLSVMGGRKDSGLDEEKLQIILNRILAALPSAGVPVKIPAQTVAEVKTPAAVKAPNEPDAALDEIEEVLEEIEDVEAAEEVESLEPLEEIEALEDIETAEEAEEVEDLEAVEVIEEVEAVEEAETPETKVPVIDLSEMNLSAEQAEAALEAINSEETVEELEELDEAEEVDEIEPSAPLTSEMDIADLASQIEFNTAIDEDALEDDPIQEDVEIVSPFSKMFSGLPDSGEKEKEQSVDGGETIHSIKNTGENEESQEEPDPDEIETLSPDIPNNGFSLVHKPFYGAQDGANLETLEPVNQDDEPTAAKEESGALDETAADNSGIIEEREGVHYINDEVLDSGANNNADLNPNFKNLVDSIIK